MNSFFGIGFMELAFIAILALIVLGPERLPKAARDIAKAYQQVRGLSSELTSQFSEELKVLEELNPQKLMNDLTQEVINPPKKKPQPKTTAKPLAPKKPTETDAIEDPAPDEPASADVAADDEHAAIVDADPAEENRILPPTAEVAVIDEEATPAPDDAVTDDPEASAHKQTDGSA